MKKIALVCLLTTSIANAGPVCYRLFSTTALSSGKLKPTLAVANEKLGKYNWDFDLSKTENPQLIEQMSYATSTLGAKGVKLTTDKKGFVRLTNAQGKKVKFGIAPLTSMHTRETSDGSIYLVASNWDRVEIIKTKGSVSEKINVEDAPLDLVNKFTERGSPIGLIEINSVEKSQYAEEKPYYISYSTTSGGRESTAMSEANLQILLKAAKVDSFSKLVGYAKVVNIPGDVFTAGDKFVGKYEYKVSKVIPSEAIFDEVVTQLLRGRAPNLGKFKNEDLWKALERLSDADRKKIPQALFALSGGKVYLTPLENKYLGEDLYRLIHPQLNPNRSYVINLFLMKSDFRDWPGSPMINGAPRKQ